MPYVYTPLIISEIDKEREGGEKGEVPYVYTPLIVLDIVGEGGGREGKETHTFH